LRLVRSCRFRTREVLVRDSMVKNAKCLFVCLFCLFSTVGRDSRAPFEPFVHPRSTTPQKPSPVQPALTSRLKGQEFVDVEDAAASRALKGLVDVASDLVVHGVSYTFNNDQCEPSSVYRTGLRRTSSTPNHT
jgi:hypothetical protein